MANLARIILLNVLPSQIQWKNEYNLTNQSHSVVFKKQFRGFGLVLLVGAKIRVGNEIK